MKKIRVFVAFLAVLAVPIAAPAAQAADTVATNTCPTDPFIFGSGNDYSPCNAAVLTTEAGGELGIRFHETFQPAAESDANAVYSFALAPGRQVSYDFTIDMPNPIDVGLGLITLTNVGTGATFSYNPFTGFGSGDNAFFTSGIQNSARLNWFTPAIGFDPNANGLYSATLTYDDHSLTAFAKIGEGIPAVPEPATWAMMLLGFGLVGGVMRSKNREQMPRMRFA